MKALSRQRRLRLQRRKYLAALVRYFYTGEWHVPFSPVLPHSHLSWPAGSPPSSIPTTRATLR